MDGIIYTKDNEVSKNNAWTTNTTHEIAKKEVWKTKRTGTRPNRLARSTRSNGAWVSKQPTRDTVDMYVAELF